MKTDNGQNAHTASSTLHWMSDGNGTFICFYTLIRPTDANKQCKS